MEKFPSCGSRGLITAIIIIIIILIIINKNNNGLMAILQGCAYVLHKNLCTIIVT